MTRDLYIVIPGCPVAQPRVKACIRGKHAGVYTPSVNGITAYKALIRAKAAEAYTDAPHDGPVEIECEFIFPRTKGETWKKRPMTRILHTKKPDLDNLVKAVKDALTSIAWADDSQVCYESAWKVTAAGEEQPKTILRVKLRNE